MTTDNIAMVENCAALFLNTGAFFADQKDEWVSGQAIFESSEQFDERLQKLAPSSKIYVIGSRSIALLIAYCAVWRLGHVLIPVDSKVSLKRLKNYCETVQPDFAIIVDEPEEQACLEYLMQVCHLYSSKMTFDLVNTEVSNNQTEADQVHQSPTQEQSQPALIVFTSGSTGLPKGVVLSHQHLFLGAHHIVSHNQLSTADVALCLLPLNHINGIVTTILAPALSGSRVLYYQQGFSDKELLALIKAHSVTWVSGVPFHYNQLVKNHQGFEETSSESLKTVRFFRSASAPLSKTTLEQFEQRFQKPLVETMGMSEAAGQIFANPIESGQQKKGSIGRLVGFDADIRDSNGSSVLDGIEGEIYIKSDGLFLGYYKENRFESRVQDWFQTGDLGVRDADGFYRITGRAKDIAIFAGENFSLRFIEKQLEELDGIDDVGVKACPNEHFNECIDIYFVSKNSLKNNQQAALKQKLDDVLPSPCFLNALYRIKELPRSSAGKMLKGELTSELAIETLELYPRAGNPLESLKNLLGVKVLNESDALGVTPGWDSLLQTSLVVYLEENLQRPLNAEEMIHARSVQGLKSIDLVQSAAGCAVTQQDLAIDDYIEHLERLGLTNQGLFYLILSASNLASAGVTDVERFLKTLLRRFDQAQFVMNTFTWSFCRGEPYDARWTPCETGLVNEIFRKLPETKRTHHPIYSYATYGIPDSVIGQWRDAQSWGADSFLNYLCEHPKVRVISHGPGFLKGNPALHWVEQRFSVPYRFHKTFSGAVRFFGQTHSNRFDASMFVRQLGEQEYVNDWTPLGVAMKEKEAFVGETEIEPFYSYELSDLVQSATQLLDQDLYRLARPVV